MKQENLDKINDALDKAGIAQTQLAKFIGMQNSQVNEYLMGKRKWRSAMLSVAIEAMTEGKIKAKWILETEFNDSLEQDLQEARIEIKSRLEYEAEKINKRFLSI